MHDAASLTVSDAILRHGGEAYFAMLSYRFLTPARRRELAAFLASL